MLATFKQEACGSEIVLSIRGEIDMSNVSEMARAIDEASSASPGILIVDLAGVTYLDSTCLRELVRSRRTMDERGHPMSVAAPAASIARSILERAGLVETLGVMGSIGEALGTGQRTQH